MNENSYVIESGGDGGGTEIVTGEAALRKAVHDLMCCGQCNPIVMCETAGVTETLSTLDEDDEWSSNYPTYARFTWNADFEDGYIRVLNLGQRPADPAWISVSERTPDVGAEVFACFEGQFKWVMFVATMTRHDGLCAAGYASPSYWQPLPSPPLASQVPKEKD